ncbi:c-type cytochrome [Mesorhizobium delmotii]|uniref:Cytochrome c, class II n=1 Tax=Mesorhizobium delmotii TaxID=1631247 RepID=A0A2P9ARJ2_9HYPH|nr:cytochrome c [Mesorhizobium delmotii]SJM33697.1 Cytochrome c, class II [Mesorhizobium delmotii]
MYKYRLTVVAVSALVATGSLAHEGAMGVIAERMTVMKEMAQTMKTLGEMLNGRREFDARLARASIAAMHEKCHQASEQFTSGTSDHASRAAPAVWEKPDEFKAEMERFDAAVKALLAASEAGDLDAIRVPFKKVGQACSSCHGAYRVPE